MPFRKTLLASFTTLVLTGCYTQLAIKEGDPEPGAEPYAEPSRPGPVIIIEPVIIEVPVPYLPLPHPAPPPPPPVGGTSVQPAPAQQSPKRDVGNHRGGSTPDTGRSGRGR